LSFTERDREISARERLVEDKEKSIAVRENLANEKYRRWDV